MNLFPTAFAEETAEAGAAGAPQPQGDFTFLLIMVAVLVVFYFFMMRPQNKQRKEKEKMLSELKAGDEILLASGIVGKIVKVSDDQEYYTVAINESSNVMVKKNYVVNILPKGTFESVQPSKK